HHRLRGRARSLEDGRTSERQTNEDRGSAEHEQRTLAGHFRLPSTTCGYASKTRERGIRLRGRVPPGPVDKERVEAVGELVGVRAGPKPGVGPVRGRKEGKGSGRDV